MSPPTIRIVIADDYPIILKGLVTVLEAVPQFQIVGFATSFAELPALLARKHANVLVLDLHGMGVAPVTQVTALRRHYPGISIVVFSSIIDVSPELFRAGVRGYVAKEEALEHVVTAILSAHAGGTYRSPRIEEYMARVASKGKRPRLAPQELSVLKLMARGLGTDEIAAELQIKRSTTLNYITNMKQKTGLRERTQLVDWYRRTYGSDDEQAA